MKNRICPGLLESVPEAVDAAIGQMDRDSWGKISSGFRGTYQHMGFVPLCQAIVCQSIPDETRCTRDEDLFHD